MRYVWQMEVNHVSPKKIAETSGFPKSTVYGWRKRYREGGWDALRARPVPGPASALTPELRAKLAAMLRHNPQEYGFGPALWTRGLVQQLVKNEFGVELSEVRIGQILREMHFSPQRPVHKAVQQDPKAVRKWREEEYPKIRDEAEDASATVYFGDEAGVRADHHAGTTWAPVGQTPEVTSTGERNSLGMVSAVSLDGELHFQLFEGTMTAARFIGFCEHLLEGDGGRVFLIVDNSTTHTANAVARFVESTEGRLRLFFLPSYSPELNPDELVWNNVKNDQVGKRCLLRGGDLFDAVWTALANLKKAPEKVRGFFGGPARAYIWNVSPTAGSPS